MPVLPSVPRTPREPPLAPPMVTLACHRASRGPVPLESIANRRRFFYPSRRVIRVQPDVLVGQIARPEAAAAVAEREAQPQMNLAFALQVRRRRGHVERLRRAPVVQQHV